MSNLEVAEALRTISEILGINGENPFKVRAYSMASRAVEGLNQDLEILIEEGTMTDVPGIGESIAAKIVELLETGRIALLEEMRRGLAPGVLEILHSSSIGPKKAVALSKKLGITSVEELRAACLEDRLLGLPGFGARTEQKILEGIEFRASHQGEYLLSAALPLARDLVRSLEGCRDVLRVSIAGSVRRWRETVRDIDLLASSARPGRVMDYFVKLGTVKGILARGQTKSSVRLANGLQVDPRVVSDEEFPYALVYFTGNKDDNVAMRLAAKRHGLKLSEYGIFRGADRVPCRDEADVYEALGLPYIPPEMRENSGELSAGSIPLLVRLSDLKGVFHVHSTWSDGTATIEQMAQKARSMGLTYLGLSDHSRSAGYARGLDETRLGRQMDEVDRLNERWRDFRILKGLECDILADGGLHLEAPFLRKLDFVIGSVHSHFSLPEKEMTDRVCRALADPNLDILGHTQGRLLLGRSGYRIDLGRVIDAAQNHGKRSNSMPIPTGSIWIGSTAAGPPSGGSSFRSIPTPTPPWGSRTLRSASARRGGDGSRQRMSSTRGRGRTPERPSGRAQPNPPDGSERDKGDLSWPPRTRSGSR